MVWKTVPDDRSATLKLRLWSSVAVLGTTRSPRSAAEMETGRVDRRRLPVGSGRVGSTLDDRCVTGRPHKMQKETF